MYRITDILERQIVEPESSITAKEIPGKRVYYVHFPTGPLPLIVAHYQHPLP